MRAKEFIREGIKAYGSTVEKLATDVSDAMPGAFTQRQLRNTDPYMQYRYGVAVASARAIKNGELKSDTFNQETDFAENVIQVMYAPEDEETIKLASKLFGVTPTRVADTRSHEDKETNTQSPVAKKTKNRYGV